MKIVNTPYRETKCEIIKGLTEYFAKQYHENIKDPDIPQILRKEFSLSAVEDNTTLGQICASVDYVNLSATIEDLYVDPEKRRGGIGQQLVAEYEKTAKKEGCVMSFVDTTKASAPTFYEKQGYQLIGTIPDFPITGDVYYRYYKWLGK
ncbi:MAG: GNAT family N-acetyltransferase [Lactobacillus sp.]|jgi:ribosomal protein S18 acetylase RimI-like enzyme|nr:GNAT family N-acetyltransferase [Lactobacillus sp.]MCH3990037.1 GNAT family N-acetyltransferase [Lactobacillus sp.]MCH4069249.1 GNAT family N-acetyltransferase [Lactobacillus sp.]MCI1303551.1 GNAT family N-acetyltransferase [Lactobacillus sp.]MCI1329727.1 GNAT family N-acetyltransferase [Lactobacillus sp.]